MPEATATEVHWYVSHNGKTVGPFSAEQVISHMLSRKIPAGSLACPDGGDAWRPLDQWPVFHDVAAQIFPKAAPKRSGMEWTFLIYDLILNPLLLLVAAFVFVTNAADINGATPWGQAERSAYLAFVIARALPRAWMIAAGFRIAMNRGNWKGMMMKGMVGHLLISAVAFPLVYSITSIASALQAQAMSAADTQADAVFALLFFSLPEIFALLGGLIWLWIAGSPGIVKRQGAGHGD